MKPKSPAPTPEMTPREVIQDEVRNAHAWRFQNELAIRATENRARLTGNLRPVDAPSSTPNLHRNVSAAKQQIDERRATRPGLRKLAVCYPGDIASVFMVAFESMVNIEQPDGYEVRWFRGLGWCQARRRIHAAEQAIEWGAGLIATLDVDQVYQPDVLVRLVARHVEGCEMVAAMVPARGVLDASSGMKPFQRMAWKIEGEKFVPVDATDGDLQRAEYPACCAILFRASDLLKLRKPWYFEVYDSDTWESVAGEDGIFVLRMQEEVGVKAWVDTTIKVRHANVFAIDETYSARFVDWAEPGGRRAWARSSSHRNPQRTCDTDNRAGERIVDE